MPFSTDTKWPQGLLDIFEFHRNQKHPQLEYLYFGPYINLLNHAIVEDSFTLFITPQTTYEGYSPDDYVPGPFATFLVVMTKEHKPILLVEIKPDEWADDAFCRRNADTQMRRRFNQIRYQCPIPRLYGLSLLGTSLRVYCADKAAHKITPDFVRNPGMDIIPSDFLQGQWNLDILSPDGLTKMQEIIGYIKAEVEAANVGQ
jgi:hypothetical protein